MLPSLFIASSTEGREIALHLQEALERDAEATVWDQGAFGLGDTTLGSLLSGTRTFDFAVFVLTPDDMVVSRERERPAARDNVLFELGLFLGSLGPERTFIVLGEDDDIELPSDLAGVTFTTYRRRDNLLAALGPTANKIRRAFTAAGQDRPAFEDQARHGPENERVNAAKAILLSDLAGVESVLDEIGTRNRWPIRREEKWRETWETYRELFATRREPADFNALGKTFSLVAQLQQGLLAGDRELIPTDPTFLDKTRRGVEDARERLSG